MDETQSETSVPQKSNMGMYLGAGVVLLLVIGGYLLLSNQSKTQPTQTSNQTVIATPTVAESTPTAEPTSEASGSGQKSLTKTFTLSAKNFSFDVKEMKVKKGDTVKVILTSSSGFHDWVVDEFDARTKQVQTGQTAEVEFVANKAGTFEYYCSVGQHRQNGMVGNLIVE